MCTPSDTDIAWAAGFIEGDGYIGSSTTTPLIEVTQKQEWPLHKLHALFGGSVHQVHNQGINKKSYHKWRVTGNKARQLAIWIKPYLSPEKLARLEKHGHFYTV